VAVTAVTTAWIDDLAASVQSRGRMPSLVLGVLRDGRLWHVAAAGGTGPTQGTQYPIASITKTFTAVLVMRLRDDGRLALDDPLERHLPGTPVGRVSIRQLLGHASGIRREPAGPWWEREPGMTLDALLAGLDEESLLHPPHRTFHYSNLAYALLGAAASRITGEAWVDLMTRRLLSPLGMGRTTYQCEEPFARGYVVHPWLDTLREEPRHDYRAMAPAGQLWSTVEDLARWAAFLATPVAEVLDPATVEEMTMPVTIVDPDRWTGGYGLGLQLFRRGERVLVGHGGSLPGYLSMLMVHRQSGAGAVAFCNVYNAQASIAELCGRAIEEVLELEAAPAPKLWRPADPPAEVTPLCGRWWSMGQEYEATYDPTRGHLVFRFLATDAVVPWRFVPDGTDRWRCVSGSNDGERMTVRRGSDGNVTALDMSTYEFVRDPWPDI
jgi:CubicO group peptidase (beta-lactamase class C family)